MLHRLLYVFFSLVSIKGYSFEFPHKMELKKADIKNSWDHILTAENGLSYYFSGYYDFYTIICSDKKERLFRIDNLIPFNCWSAFVFHYEIRNSEEEVLFHLRKNQNNYILFASDNRTPLIKATPGFMNKTFAFKMGNKNIANATRESFICSESWQMFIEDDLTIKEKNIPPFVIAFILLTHDISISINSCNL